MDVPPLLGLALHADDFVLAEWADDGVSSAERPIAPLHVHERDDEAWYVLEGALGFRRGDDTLTVPAGGAVVVRAGTPHTYWNATAGRTRYLLVMTPRIAALIEALHEPFDDLDVMLHRFDSHLAE